MAELTLYVGSSWTCPWTFHAMVALEEKSLSYKLEVVPSPLSATRRAELQQRSVLGSLPVLVDSELWLSESLAISEYLAEAFPTPAYPRLFPAHLGDRARARQVMSFLRTSLAALKEDRPTSSVFQRPTMRPLTEQGRADATELLRVAVALIKPGQTTLFAAWCIADIDLGLALMRLIANQDAVPDHLIKYALAQWDRRSVRRYIAHLPTTP
ncbi:MAG: glutathione transferase [Deltaproteobacteria bacterium]|nr:glutathione transferase [Deltaproteobacteria bacterium]